MKDNPKAALAALTSPAKLTLGKVALLCRLDSPILAGKIDDMPKCLTAIFVVENDFADSVANFSRIEDMALIAYGGISPLEYRQKLAHTLDEVAAFFEMLPRPSPASKKISATDGSPSAANGSAEPTATVRTTSSANSQRSRRRSCGAAGCRGRAEARPARS